MLAAGSANGPGYSPYGDGMSEFREQYGTMDFWGGPHSSRDDCVAWRFFAGPGYWHEYLVDKKLYKKDPQSARELVEKAFEEWKKS